LGIDHITEQIDCIEYISIAPPTVHARVLYILFLHAYLLITGVFCEPRLTLSQPWAQYWRKSRPSSRRWVELGVPADLTETNLSRIHLPRGFPPGFYL